jgi:hypothetical protein
MADKTPMRSPGPKADKKLRDWVKRIDDGIKARNEVIDEWRRNEDYAVLAQDQMSEFEMYGDGDQAAVNKVGSWLESRMATLAYRNPRVKLRPKKQDGWDGVPMPVVDPMTGQPQVDPMTGRPTMRMVPKYRVMESTVNNIVSQPSFQLGASSRLFVKSALLAMGCMKIGYWPQFEQDKDKAEPIHADNMMLFDPKYLLDKYEFTDGEDGAVIPMFDKDGFLVPRGTRPISEEWFIDWVDHKKMVFDPDGQNDFRQHRWVAYQYTRPLKDIQNDPTFKNTKDLQATAKHQFDENEKKKTQVWGSLDTKLGSGDDREREGLVDLVEIWDFDDQEILVIADGHDQFLKEDPCPKGVDPVTGPYVVYRPIERLGEWYPHPPASDLVPINKSYNKANSLELAEMGKAKSKMIVKEDGWDSTGLSKLKSTADEVIVYKGALTLPESVYVVQMPNRAAELFAHKMQYSKDFDEVAAQSAEERGQAASDTATQSRIMDSRSRERTDFQRSVLGDAWKQIFKKLIDSIQANMTKPQYVTINGEDGSIMSIEVSREMILGDYEVEIDVEDLAPTDRMAEGAQLANLLVTVSQAPWMAADERGFEELCKIYGVSNKPMTDAIARGAQMQLAMLMAPKQPAKPATDAPQDEATAISQQGGAF